MQKWEYLQVHYYSRNLRVFNSKGEYFTDDEYKFIDPKGKRVRDNSYGVSVWQAGMHTDSFRMTVLTILGTQGWEAIGNISEGHVYLLLKRPLSE